MQKYIGVPSNINMKLFLLQKEAQTISKTIYPDAMEARDHFQPNLLAKFEQKITQYKAWRQYVST